MDKQCWSSIPSEGSSNAAAFLLLCPIAIVHDSAVKGNPAIRVDYVCSSVEIQKKIVNALTVLACERGPHRFLRNYRCVLCCFSMNFVCVFLGHSSSAAHTYTDALH